MSFRTETNSAIPLEELGKGPRRDPPLWARSVRLLLNHVTATMRDFYGNAAPDQIWSPTLIAVCKNGDVAPLVQGDSFHRDDWAVLMRRVFREAGVVRYVHTQESWMTFGAEMEGPMPSTTDPASDRLLDEGVAPVADPSRKEVALAYASERKGRSEGKVLELVRGESGRVCDIRDLTESMAGPDGRGLAALGPLTRLF